MYVSCTCVSVVYFFLPCWAENVGPCDVCAMYTSVLIHIHSLSFSFSLNVTHVYIHTRLKDGNKQVFRTHAVPVVYVYIHIHIYAHIHMLCIRVLIFIVVGGV